MNIVSGAPVLAAIAIVLLVIAPVTGEPTVTISDYQVTPQVLMPGDLGTVTVTLKNTATTASFTEKTGPLSSDMSRTRSGTRSTSTGSCT